MEYNGIQKRIKLKYEIYIDFISFSTILVSVLFILKKAF